MAVRSSPATASGGGAPGTVGAGRVPGGALRPRDAGREADRAWRLVVAGTIAGAWLIAAAAQATGNATVLHHHALIEGGPPLWVAAPVFLLGWGVMVVAMMLPASMPALGVIAATSPRPDRPGRDLAGFLATFAVAWAVFGLAAFLGDLVLHHVVAATPWLGERPWLIEASVLALAGLYQLTPSKRRGLTACRHPDRQARGRPPGERRGPPRLGAAHARDCLGTSWALMLVMFGAGVAELPLMAALTGVMTYEATGRHGSRLASVVGVALVCWALLDVSSATAIG